MDGRQIFSIHIVLKCQRSSEARTFARLQYFCTFVIEIKDRMQYYMEEPKRGCQTRALSLSVHDGYTPCARRFAPRGRALLNYVSEQCFDFKWYQRVCQIMHLYYGYRNEGSKLHVSTDHIVSVKSCNKIYLVIFIMFIRDGGANSVIKNVLKSVYELRKT